MIDSKALGKDEGAISWVVCDAGGEHVGVHLVHDRCVNPRAPADHPQSTKEGGGAPAEEREESISDVRESASVKTGAAPHADAAPDAKAEALLHALDPFEGGMGMADAALARLAAAPAEPGASATPLPNRREFEVRNHVEYEAAMREAQGGDSILIVAPLPPAQPAEPREVLCQSFVRLGEYATICGRQLPPPPNYSSAQIYRCGGREDEHPVYVHPAEQKQLGKEGVGAAPLTADELGKLLDRAAPGADYLAASLRGQFPMRTESAGAAPKGEQEERACYHCDRPIMVPAGSPRIHTCGKCEDSAPDLSEVFAPPSASEKQDSTAGAAAVPEAGARDRLIEVETVLRDLTGAIVKAMKRGEIHVGPIEPALTMALSVADGGHATLDDARIAALSSPSGHARPDPWRSPVLRYALPELLGVASDRLDRQYDNTIGDLRAAAEHFRDHPPGALRAELRRLALAFATEGSRYERAGNVSGAAQMRRVSNLLYALEKSGTAVVFTPIPGDEEAEIEKLKAAHVADRRKIMESAKLLLADKDAAEAEVLRLTKERDFEREQRDLRHAAWLEERASVKALREALEAAIAAQRYQAEASPAVYEGGTLAEPEIDAIDMCAACGDGDWPCVNPACWVSRGLALLAPPNPSAEKLTPGPRE